MNYGISFSNNVFALEETPSGNNIIAESASQNIVVDVVGGFIGGLSFLYETIQEQRSFARVYDSPGGTGKLLATQVLPAVVDRTFIFMPISGTAKSVVLGSGQFFDDFVFGFAMPQCSGAEIWDPTTKAYVGPLENGST